MPVVGVPIEILKECLGAELDANRLVEHLQAFGCDVEGFTEVRRHRCERCGKTICNACSPGAEMNICVTCERLRSSAGSSDPRLRQAQLSLDRARRKRVTLGLFGSGILIPGLSALFEGRIASGCARIAAVGAGIAMLLIPSRVPGPWEIGDLGHTLSAILGFGLLIPSYAFGWWESFKRLRRWRLTS